jgi:hypothetical protein
MMGQLGISVVHFLAISRCASRSSLRTALGDGKACGAQEPDLPSILTQAVTETPLYPLVEWKNPIDVGPDPASMLGKSRHQAVLKNLKGEMKIITLLPERERCLSLPLW